MPRRVCVHFPRATSWIVCIQVRTTESVYKYMIMPTNQITYFTEWKFSPKTKHNQQKVCNAHFVFVFVCICSRCDGCNSVHDTRQYQINRFNVTITILVSSAFYRIWIRHCKQKKHVVWSIEGNFELKIRFLCEINWLTNSRKGEIFYYV